MGQNDAAPYQEIAAAQHGVVGRTQLVRAGLSAARVQRWVSGGRLVPLHAGVYLVAGAPHTPMARLVAACLAVDGVASHGSAGWLLALRDCALDEIHVTVDVLRRFAPQGVHLHRSTDLERTDLLLVEGIACTGVERTLLDLGLTLGPRRLDRVAEDAVRRGLTTWDAVLTTFLRHARRGRGGTAAMRKVLDERALLDPRLESRLETEFWRLLAAAGVRAPTPQVEVFDGAGFVARVDFAYADLMIAIELDGKAFHLTSEAFEADREKRQRLRAAGWIVLELTWDMVVRRPEYVITVVRKALASRMAA